MSQIACLLAIIQVSFFASAFCISGPHSRHLDISIGGVVSACSILFAAKDPKRVFGGVGIWAVVVVVEEGARGLAV